MQQWPNSDLLPGIDGMGTKFHMSSVSLEAIIEKKSPNYQLNYDIVHCETNISLSLVPFAVG